VDRLRSLQYFIASAEEGSFSGAARRLEISVPAVAKMIAALERDLGLALFERSAQGLALTGAGEGYLETCRPMVAALLDLDEQMRASSTRVRGTIVVGIQHVAAKELLAPALPRFHARHPEIQIDLRESTQVVHADAPGVDVFLSFGWADAPDMIHRPLAMSRFRVCASPSYWAAHGMPANPRELQSHSCLLIRTQRGTVMDVWAFARDGVREDVTVKGWLVCNNAHRDVAIGMGVAGLGVIRILEWANLHELESGALVPALQEWECPDAPPIVLSYRPSVRRVSRVRIFVEFVQELFRELEHPQLRKWRVTPAPQWAGSNAARASSLLARPRR
jgi:DNA-binding transcriptional LysR family regulator